MKLFSVTAAALASLLLHSKAFAVQGCSATVPAACDIIGSQILISSGNTIFALTVDCKFSDGRVIKLAERASLQGIGAAVTGYGIENLPSHIEITKRTDNFDVLKLQCR